jgi:hypothetical protein
MFQRRHAALAAVTLILVAVTIPALAAGPTTRLVSRASNGDPAENGTDATAISGNGAVAAFTSTADNLPQGGGPQQVYARDTDTAKTFLVSRTSGGDVGDDISQEPWPSTNGRYVAFNSYASNLPDGDGSTQRMYIHDLETRTTRLVSKNSDGEPPDDPARSAGISADGRVAAFASQADNLPGSASINDGFFVHDRTTGKTILASRASDGTPVESGSGQISSGGDHVVFESDSSDLPGGDGSTDQVYVRDLRAGTTKLASKNTQGDVADGECGYSAVAGDGSVAVFVCTTTNLPGGDGSTDQVYARDLGAGTTRLVSKNQDGDPADDGPDDPFVSANGRVVSFYTNSDNLPGRDGQSEVYAYDLRAEKLRIMSRNADGEVSDDSAEAYPPSLSRDGSYAAFRTNASNLPGTDGLYTQLFIRGPLD